MTVAEILERALSRSRRFVPEGTSATLTGTEAVSVVQDSLDALFQIGARVNPAFYGDSEDVTYSSGWARPTTAEAVDRIERADGEEVIVVPRSQPNAEPGFPCVYRWGRVYHPAGVTAGPETSETLTFLFSRIPERLSADTDEIDEAYPEGHTTLLELDVAIRAAIKDGGPTAEIVEALGGERTEAFRRYVAFLEHETTNERRSYGLVRKFTTNTLVPLHSMLAGG